MQSDQPMNILEVLDGLPFPATVAEMVSYAEDSKASEDVLDQIQAMPDRDYVSIHDVAMHLGQLEHQPGESNEISSAPEDTLFSADERPLDLRNEKL